MSIVRALCELAGLFVFMAAKQKLGRRLSGPCGYCALSLHSHSNLKSTLWPPESPDPPASQIYLPANKMIEKGEG